MPTPSFKFPMSLGPTFIESVGLDKVRGATNTVISGTVTGGDIGTTFDVKPSGGTITYLSSAERMSIVSSSAADTLGGTGSNVVQILGLDNTYNEIEEIVELNGITPVLTVGTYLRVNTIRQVVAGSGVVNAGLITVTAEIAGTVQNTIQTGHTTSGQSHYTVPLGSSLLLRNLIISTGKGDEVEIEVAYRPLGAAWLHAAGAFAYEGFNEATNIDIAFPAKTDLKMIGTALTQNPKVDTTMVVTLVRD